VIAWLRSTNREQRKLLFSLVANFLTRIPGAIGVIWFLPLLRFGLGTADYANLLSSTALGSAAAFLSGGFSLVGRRLIGHAYAEGDLAGEADGFVSLLIANAVALIFALAIVAGYCWVRGASSAVLVVATLPPFVAFLNTFDNVRSAYNEHYVNATLLIALQATTYALGFLLPATRHSILLGALVLHGPYLLTSLLTLVLLLRNRLHLIGGRPVAIWVVARQGTMLAIADGFLLTTLSLSVVWLQITADATTSAWFATNVRLFQTLYVPVLLLLVPLSSYVRISWNGKSVAQQQAFTKAMLSLGLGYGAIVAVALLGASRIYLAWMLHLPAPGSLLAVSPIFLLFGAIIAYKSYSSMAYVVLDEVAHLSSWTTVAVGAAVALGVVASLDVDPLNAVNVYAVAAGLSVIIVLFWNVVRFIRATSTHTGRGSAYPSQSLHRGLVDGETVPQEASREPTSSL
jgi:hypothetical protein